MNLEQAWRTASTTTAGLGIGHAVSSLLLGGETYASAWLVIAGGMVMLAICAAGIYQERKRA